MPEVRRRSRTSGKYSWIKAPRFDGKAMQVGPLAQVLIGFASGHPLFKKYVDYSLDTLSKLAGTTLGAGDRPLDARPSPRPA